MLKFHSQYKGFFLSLEKRHFNSPRWKERGIGLLHIFYLAFSFSFTYLLISPDLYHGTMSLKKKFLVFTLKRCITRFSAFSKILNRRNRRSGFQAFSVSLPLLLLLVSSLDSRARHAFASRSRPLASPKKNAKKLKKNHKNEA